MYTNHSALKYLVKNIVLGGEIYIWLILFQEFDFEVIVKPSRLNVGPDHLSRIESGEKPTSLEDNLPNVKIFAVTMMDNQDLELNAIIHFLSTSYAPPGSSINQKKQLVVRAADFTLIARHLYKLSVDEILHRYVFEHERSWVMNKEHASVMGGHY